MADVDASRELLARVIDMGPGLGWAAIVTKAGDTVVGNAAVQPTPGDRTDIEVGWHLARRHWGNGFATEAAQALIEHAFTTLDLDCVVADIVPGNERSARVAARLGMRPEDRTERAGRPHDVWVL